MKLPPMPYTVTDWSHVPVTEHPGETGMGLWRMLNAGDLRVRMVDYLPGYRADHWCDRGHVIYVIEGQLDTELQDGRVFTLTAGMSYQVSDFGDFAAPVLDHDRREIIHRGLKGPAMQDDEPTRPLPRLTKPVLDPMGVTELRDYIAELHAEISRVEQAIAQKHDHRSAAESVFGKRGGA